MRSALPPEFINQIRNYGGRTWARTKDPLIKSQLLYQLSYASVAIPSSGSRRGAPLASHPRVRKGSEGADGEEFSATGGLQRRGGFTRQYIELLAQCRF